MNNLFPFLALNKIALQLGPLAIHWYAIFIVGGAALAVWLACKEAPKRNIKTDDIIDFVLFAFPLGIVGARLYYVIFQWSYYSQHPYHLYRCLTLLDEPVFVSFQSDGALRLQSLLDHNTC